MTADMQDKASVTVKPLDLSNLLKHAFMSGQGSMTTHSQWVDYDPSECPAYERIAAALAQAYQPIGYITPDALKQLRMGIDCQPIHKDDRHGFTVPVYATPPTALSVEKAPAVDTPPPVQHVLAFPRELTGDLRDILSMMMWNTGPIAHALRAGGVEIKTRAEDEQAHVMHWLITLALEHGSEWREKASDRINEIRAALATTEGSDNG